ncbi:MAG: hypothetical protein Kow002_08460 [Anaerolineales bacterium]
MGTNGSWQPPVEKPTNQKELKYLHYRTFVLFVKEQFWSKECGKRGVLNPRRGYTEAQRGQIIAAYYERPSMRGIERIFGVSRHTLAKWLEKKSPIRPGIERDIASIKSQRCP